MLEAGFDATALAEEEPKPIVKVFPVGKAKTNCVIVGCEQVGFLHLCKRSPDFKYVITGRGFPVCVCVCVSKKRTNDRLTVCLLFVTKSRECVVIDPGGDADRIVHEIVQSSLLLKRILVSHAHFDAVLGLDELRKHLRLRTQFVADLRGRAKVHRKRIEVAMHAADADLLNRVDEQ